MTEDLFSKQNISPEIEEYDPLHTMLALNMAIVSIHKISTTQDRIILQQEYSNIINRLALGNIKADNDMTGLYSELMDFITGKGLRQDEVKKLSEIYKHLEQEKFYKAFSKIKAPIVEKRIDNVFKRQILNFLPVKNKARDSQEAAINLMAGFINGKRNNQRWN